MAFTASRIFIVWQRKQPFAAPDADDPYVLRIAAVNDTKRLMDEFAQERLVELGYDPAHLGMVTQRFDPSDDFLDEPIADVGHPNFYVPGSDRFQIRNRRFGEANGDLGHPLT